MVDSVARLQTAARFIPLRHLAIAVELYRNTLGQIGTAACGIIHRSIKQRRKIPHHVGLRYNNLLGRRAQLDWKQQNTQ